MRFYKIIIGITIYSVLKNISLRFLLPKKYIHFLEELRTHALRLQGAKIGNGSVVRNNVFIAYPKNLIIGSGVTIGPYSNIFNYVNVEIEDDVELGPCLHIQTNDHVWGDKNAALGKQGAKMGKVFIGYGVFIGARVTILQGVTIKRLSVIAAGSVVTRSLESGAIYGGIPAKRLQSVREAKD